MAAKREQIRLGSPETIDIDPETGRILGDDDTDTSGLENDQDKLLDDIIGEFGAGDNEVSYSASITRIPKGFQRGQKEPWLFECDASEIIGIRTRLRDVYRGGQFRIRVYKTTSRGKKLYRQMDYFIEAPETVAASTGDAKYDALSAALERTNAQMLTLAERLSTPPQIQGQQIDPFAMMEKMSTIMKNMMPQQPAIAHDNSFTMKDGMELFTKGMEIASDFKGDGTESWIGVFKEMAKNIPIGEILENLTKAQQNRNPQTQRRQLAGPQQRPFQPQQPAPQPVNGLSPETPAATGQALEQSMRYLIGRAQKNADPGLYAEWLLDNADKSLIRSMANDPNVLDQLAVIFPGLNQPLIRAWFTELVESVKEILDQIPQNEDAPTGIAEPRMDGTPFNGGGGDASNPGWGLRDENNPQDHARVSETGAT
jgi:hypothetical protein